MSLRRREVVPQGEADFRNVTKEELQSLRDAHLGKSGPVGGPVDNSISTGVLDPNMRAFDRLTPTEQQVATLGVHPDAFRPLKSLNDGHFEILRQANALSPALEAQINAYRLVSEASNA